jgi:hypothetical protein
VEGSRDARVEPLLAVVGIAATLVGVAWLEPSEALGFGRSLAWLAELPTTLPAALLVLLAFSGTIAAGAILVALLLRRPFESLTDAALAGLAGAVAFDCVLLFGLGQVGWLRMPIVLAAHAAVLGLGWWRRSALFVDLAAVRRAVTPRRPAALWWLIALPFAGAVLLQLASPVVPFLDVLPNHVAPAEHVRTFGAFERLETMPSPIYGPSRAFLGYTALLGTIAMVTGLPAGLAIAASILPQAILVSLGVRRLARAVAGPAAEPWALLAFLLTASFGRLTDARANILVLPLVFWVLARLHEHVVPDAPETDREDAATDGGRAIGLGLGAAFLVHPLLGLFAAATVGLVAIVDARRAADAGVSALAIGGAIALPQFATTLGFGLPAAAGLMAAPAVVGADLLVRRVPVLRDAIVWAGWFVLLAAVPAALLFADHVVRGFVIGLAPVLGTMPLLIVAAGAGIVLAGRAVRSPVAIAGVAVAAAVATFTQLVPDEGLLGQTIRFELPKELDYWLPAMAVVPAGIGLAALAARASVAEAGRTSLWLLGLFVVTAALPIRGSEIDDHHRGEHRFSEAVAIDLRWAARGYWAGYPDSREVVNAPRVAILDAVRADIAAGRIGPATPVLHVASSFQQWVATPLGVFSGVIETIYTPDAVLEIHTVGGRLRSMDGLAAAIDGRSYPIVLVEPGGLADAASIRERVLAAGYVPTFVNSQGELFARQ